MMEHTRAISRIMHEEHMAVVALLERIERFIAANRQAIPEATDPDTARLLGEIASTINGELKTHFAFEEEELFPRLDNGAPSGMTTILTEEHDIITPIAKQLAEVAVDARNNGFTDARWSAFKALGGEFVERLNGHIAKEEMGLILAIEHAIDEDTDRELAGNYAMAR